MVMGACEPRDIAPRFVGAGRAEPRSGGTLSFHSEVSVRSLDPHIAFDPPSIAAMRLVLEGLLDYDHDLRIVPRLAEALPEVSESGTRFRFRLRKGVRFHATPRPLGSRPYPKGRELTASDVRWSLHHMLAPSTASPGFIYYRAISGAEAYHRGTAASISGIRVVDRYTLDIVLDAPDQTFLHAMAMTFAYPVPREQYRSWGNRIDTHPAGTGPYMLANWERGVRIEYVRNPHYWGDHQGPDRLLYYERVARHTATMRFQNGELDLIRQLTPAHHRRFAAERRWKTHRRRHTKLATFGLGMNCELAPFNNVHLRRAVAFALRRSSWPGVRVGLREPAHQLMPPELAGHHPDLKHAQRFDQRRAKAEMKRAGYPHGLPEPVTMWTPHGEDAVRHAEAVQHDLAQIGIQVRLKQVSFATYLREASKPKTVQAFVGGWSIDFPDPASFFDPLFHSRSISGPGTTNRAFYRNAELDRVLDRARIETEPDARRALYRKAGEIVARDAPWAFSYRPVILELWQPYVRRYTPHPLWMHNYRDVWLDLPRRLRGER